MGLSFMSADMFPADDHGERLPVTSRWTASVSPLDGEEVRVLRITSGGSDVAVHDMTDDELRELAGVVAGALEGSRDVRKPHQWEVDAKALPPAVRS